MKNLGTILFLVGICLFASCNSEELAKIKILKEEVLAIHDEVMPQIGPVQNLIKQLKAAVPKETDHSNVHLEVFRPRIAENIVKLENADNGMTDWMHNYQPAAEEDMDLSAAFMYYESEKQRVIQVKKDIESSMEEAKVLLSEIDAAQPASDSTEAE